MKLQQLRYLVAIVDNGLNITAAANAVFTSQPGVSKQIKLLEEELSLQLFVRKGKSLTALTNAGKQVVQRARRILNETETIKELARELAGTDQGELVIATTETQARYVLPDMLEQFQKHNPGITLRLHQGTSEQISDQVMQQEADFAIASGDSDLFDDLITLPMYRWERVILVPHGHPLTDLPNFTLADVARYPIISYTYSFTEESSLTQVFHDAGHEPNVVITAQDPDVIKTYVRKGMGIGIIACMAYDDRRDSDLVALCANSLFPSCTTWVGFHRDRFLAEYMQDFLALMIPGELQKGSPAGMDPEALQESLRNSTLTPVNRHPSFSSQFSTCCDGEFNL